MRRVIHPHHPAATYDLSEDSYQKALDALLDDPDFLDTVTDEVRRVGDTAVCCSRAGDLAHYPSAKQGPSSVLSSALIHMPQAVYRQYDQAMDKFEISLDQMVVSRLAGVA